MQDMKGQFILKNERSGFFIFLPTFCISLVILSALFLLFTLYTKATADVELVKKDIPADYQSTEEESMSALVLGCKQEADMPGFIMAFYYDAPSGIFTAVTIPPQTVITLDGRTDTIVGHYDYAGTQGSVDAVSEEFGTNLQKYFRIQQDGIANMANFLGGVNWEVASDTVVDGQQILAGRQLLDGRRIAAFLFDTETLGVVDGNLQSSLCRILFKSGFSKSLAQHYQEFSSKILENCETNMNQYDFLNREKGFESHLKNGNIQVNSFALTGEYNEEKTEFYPDSESITKIKTIFPQNRGK